MLEITFESVLMMLRHVISYGTLMSKVSKDRTWQHTGGSLPIRLSSESNTWVIWGMLEERRI